MSAVEFKEWMERNGQTVQDIAHALHIHPQTVYRFLQGKPVHRSTKVAIERHISSGDQAAKAKAIAV